MINPEKKPSIEERLSRLERALYDLVFLLKAQDEAHYQEGLSKVRSVLAGLHE